MFLLQKYSDQFKRRAINEVKKNERKIQEVATELGIPKPTLYKWVSIDRSYSSFYKNNNASEQTRLRQLEIENKILKKALFLPKTKKDRFYFIYYHKGIYPVQTMCQLLQVSPSGYYKYEQNTTSLQHIENERITGYVKDVYFQYGTKIGSPKITAILNQKHVITSQATVARILKENKDSWKSSYSEFHNNKDVKLTFHNKDTFFDSINNKYYHERFGENDINTLLESFSFKNMYRYDPDGIHSTERFCVQDNLVIQGDNLIALHKLKEHFHEKVTLIYVDPPYNTKRDNLSYRDTFSRSDYLLQLKNRLEAARSLLKKSGSIFIHCDDNEQAYIKVLADEIYGEENFINQIVWKRTKSQQNRGQIATVKDYILVYAKNKKDLRFNRMNITAKQLKTYKHKDHHGLFRPDKILNSKNGYYHYEFVTPSGKTFHAKADYSESTFKRLLESNLVYWSKSDTPYKKTYLNYNSAKLVNDLWVSESYGSTQEATEELQSIIGNNDFTYPKPEKLMNNIIKLASSEEDIVLDFFAGSGTTLSTALQLNRQFIGIELLTENFNLIKRRIRKNMSPSLEDIDKADTFITSRLKRISHIK